MSIGYIKVFDENIVWNSEFQAVVYWDTLLLGALSPFMVDQLSFSFLFFHLACSCLSCYHLKYLLL